MFLQGLVALGLNGVGVPGLAGVANSGTKPHCYYIIWQGRDVTLVVWYKCRSTRVTWVR